MANIRRRTLVVTVLGVTAAVGGFKLFLNSNNTYGKILDEIPARVLEVENELEKITSRQVVGDVESLVDSNKTKYYGDLMQEWRGYVEDLNFQSAIERAGNYKAYRAGYLLLSIIGGMVGAFEGGVLVGEMKKDKENIKQ